MKTKGLREYVRMQITEHLMKESLLNEDLVTFGNKRPNYNQIVIMAGGSGSGKGFVLNNLVGISGKVFDVDKLKAFAFQSDIIQRNAKKHLGIDIFDLDLNNPKDSNTLHSIIKNLSIDEKAFRLMFNDFVSKRENKPNLIFDVTLADLTKLFTISEIAQGLGYLKENIHIVWVVNDINVAMEQNLNRGRTVSTDVFNQIHSQVKHSLLSILNKELDIQKYMDGDFWVVFNKKGFDTEQTSSKNGGAYISKSNIVKIKPQGANFKSDGEVINTITHKILDYSKIKA